MIGSVREVSVYPEYAWVVLADSETGDLNKFILWSDSILESSPTERVIQSMWVSLLRDAMVHTIPVRIAVDSSNPLVVRGVRINPI